MTAARDAERRQAVLGVGITGMRERMRQLGGSLEIDFGQHGTTVTAVLPIEKNAP
jgi:signal transduction histidine kinase